MCSVDRGWAMWFMKTMTISEVNAMEEAEFLKKFGGVYEGALWVAEDVVEMMPFGDFEELVDRMREVVEVAGGERIMEILMAQPDLAGEGELADGFKKERAGAGLDDLDQEEVELFNGLNEAYRGIFGFPFVMCVGKADKLGILRSFGQRLLNGRAEEFRTALEEVHEIARLRIAAILAGA